MRRPGGGRPREKLNTTISTNRPEKNSTLGGVDVEGTETEHVSLFTVQGRICACRDDSFDSSVELLVDCGATSDFMSMQTAKRARLPFYKRRNPGHVLTAGVVQVKVRYYTRAYVRVGELVFRHHFKVSEILPDLVLGLPWLRSYNPTINWKERYADNQHGSNSYRLSLGESRHSAQLEFQAASKLDLLLIFSSSASERSPSEILPHMPRNAPTYTRRPTSSTVLTFTMTPKRRVVSPRRSAAISRLSTFRCRNSKERSVKLISRGIKYCCAACLDPQCRSFKCTRCKPVMTMTGLTPFDANCRFNYTSGRTSTTGRRQSMETYLRIDLVEIIEYAPIRKTILRGCTLTKWT